MTKRQRPTSVASDKESKTPRQSIFHKIRQQYKGLSSDQKKRIFRVSVFVVLILAFVITFVIRKLNDEQIVYFSDDEIQIINEDYNLELVKYEGENFSMMIPKGWEVKTTGKDETLAIYAYNPEDKRFQIFMQLQSKPLMRNYDERNIYKRYANTDEAQYGIYADAPVIRLGTLETFYQSFGAYTQNIQSYSADFADFYFPRLTNFTKADISPNTSSFGSSAKDDVTLRASFSISDSPTDTDSKNRAEGIFTGTVYSQDASDTTGYYIVYGVSFITTPEDNLLKYENDLQKSIASLKLSDELSTQISESEIWSEKAADANGQIQESAKNIAKLWQNRDSSYDTVRQKYVDTQGDFERVYDLENNCSYQAFEGFMKGYTGTRFRAATNEEYSKASAGKIIYLSDQTSN